jgi:hypothetical protein
VRIAVLTEGVSEFSSLPQLYAKLQQGTGHTLLRPLKVSVSPDAPPKVIARACGSRLIMAAEWGAEKALLILDREQQQVCSGVLANQIENAVAAVYSGFATTVVIKDRAFENWLVADLNALALQPARFSVTNGMRRTVERDKADRCGARTLLDRAVVDGSYDKVGDSKRICQRMDIITAAANSRSFRHLLHVLGRAPYATQCRRPK